MTGVTPEIIKAWRHAYPGVDVELELCRIELYLAKNPKKVYKRPLRMIETWLKRQRPKMVQIRSADEKLSERELLASGALKGLIPNPGESWAMFLRRVKAA
jgi:hypothetical protein